jgi:hypothetical protein
LAGDRRGKRNRTWLILIAVWGLSAVAILPVVFHWAAPYPRISRSALAAELGYALALLICYLIYRFESVRLPRRSAVALTFTIVLLTAIVNNVHSYYIDQASYFPYTTNEAWQETLQNNVVNLSPAVAPHSYRFLPNGIVRWVQMGHVRFRTAADVYRLLSGLLLFYAIYRFARLYANFAGGVLAMFFVAATYPVSFEQYAGQLTDPLSHLSFVLAFIFLETENFAFLITALLLGSLAKETVLALSGYYVLFCTKQRHYAIKASALCVSAVALYFAVRLYVLHGTMQYQNVSGVNAAHILDNWRDPTWPQVFLLTACGGVFFLFLSWKRTPLSLKRMYFYLLPILFVSSVFFSWIRETRNYMPLVVILSVIAARFCTAPLTEPETAAPSGSA